MAWEEPRKTGMAYRRLGEAEHFTIEIKVMD